MSDYVLDKLAASQISQGHAKVLVGLEAQEQRVVCDTIMGQKLSVRETEQLVNEMKCEKIPDTKKVPKKSEGIDLAAYKKLIEENVPFRISVKRSKVEIAFDNEEELKDFLKRVAIQPR